MSGLNGKSTRGVLHVVKGAPALRNMTVKKASCYTPFTQYRTAKRVNLVDIDGGFGTLFSYSDVANSQTRKSLLEETILGGRGSLFWKSANLSSPEIGHVEHTIPRPAGLPMR